MAAKGYCTTADVASLLGVTFDAGQTTRCTTLIEQAEVYIDNETDRGWLVGAQTDEEHYCPPHRLFVRYAPIDSVTAITGRTGIGEDDTALVVDEDYEVRDAELGLVYLVSPGSYDLVKVDYTPTASVPADIKLACTEIVANWMQPTLNPGMYGVDSYSLPDLTVRYSRAHVQAAAPPTAMMILDRYRYRIHG